MDISDMLSITAKVDGAYKAVCRPVLEKFGLLQTSFDIIMFLANNPQYYTAKQVSWMRNLRPNVVSIHVERLAQEGLLERQNVKSDRRKIRLVLTEKAEPIIACGRKLQHGFYERLVNGLTAQELESFRHCAVKAGENAEIIRSNPESESETEGN